MMLFLIYAHMCFMKPCQVANISSHFDNALTILQYNTTKVTIYPYYRISLKFFTAICFFLLFLLFYLFEFFDAQSWGVGLRGLHCATLW